MSRNGQYGQGRPPQRRNPAEQDPYAPQWPQQPGGYPDPNFANGGQQGYPPQSNQGYHYPPEPEPYGGYPQNGQGQPMPSLDRYAPQNGAAAPYQAQPVQPQWGQQDPRNYDLGSYMPNGAQGFAPPQEAVQYAPPQQQGYAPETDGEYDDGLADGEDEPRSGRRWMVIAVALVGAIGLGGGLAYTYKVLFTNSSGRAPFVRNVEPPSKVKPVTGGRETAQVDKKLFTRLGEDSSGPAGSEPEAAQDGSDAQVGGPRPVRIIPISPGGGQGPGQGQVGATSADAGARPGGGSPMVTIPGLMIDTGGAARARPTQQGPQQAMQ